MKLFYSSFFSLTLLILFMSCSDSSIAGSGSNGGNPYKVSIALPSGTPADSALIFIRNENYTSATLTLNRIADLISDENGEVEIVFPSDSSYIVEIIYGDVYAKMLSSEGVRSIQQSSKPQIVLDSTSTLSGTLDSSLISAGEYYIQFIGLERTELVPANGNFQIPQLPPGMHRYKIFDINGEYQYESTIEINPNQKIDLGNINSTDLSILNRALIEMGIIGVPIEEIAGLRANGSIINIDLQYRGITQLSPLLSKLKPAVLKIGHNPLMMLPPWIEQMESLSFLEISECGLSELPLNIGKLPNLNTIMASQNKLSSIPLSMLKNDSLKVNVQNNLLLNVDSITATWLDSASIQKNWLQTQN